MILGPLVVWQPPYVDWSNIRSAKAAQEIAKATTKGLKVAQGLGDWLDRMFGGGVEYSIKSIWTDKVHERSIAPAQAASQNRPGRNRESAFRCPNHLLEESPHKDLAQQLEVADSMDSQPLEPMP